MRFAIVESGKIVVCTEASLAFGTLQGWIPEPTGNYHRGDLYDGSVFTKAPVDQSAIRDLMVCTLAQLKAALDDAGRLDEVDAVIAAAPRKIRIVWNYSTTVTRKGKLIDYLKNNVAPSYSNNFLDNLFIDAMKLEL